MYWETSAWHMAYNASAAAMLDTKQPRMAMRLKHQHEYFIIGKDILERGIANNPDRYKLYESLGALLRDKLQDHCGSAEAFANAAKFPDSPTYEVRFAAYELSRCPGHERQAYEELVRHYVGRAKMSGSHRISRLMALQPTLLNIPESQRIKIPEDQLPPNERTHPAPPQRISRNSRKLSSFLPPHRSRRTNCIPLLAPQAAH